MKYATAIWPDRMKATGRVNSPISSSAPPTTSRMPATPISDISCRSSNIATCGTLNSLAVPCSRNRKAVTMRSSPCERGTQASSQAVAEMAMNVSLV